MIEIFIIILSIVINSMFLIITCNQNRKDLRHKCENIKIYNLLIEIFHKKPKKENFCVEDDIKTDVDVKCKSQKNEYIFDKYSDMNLMITFILSDIIIFLINMIYGDLHIILSLLLCVVVKSILSYIMNCVKKIESKLKFSVKKITILSIKVFIYFSLFSSIIQLFSINESFSNGNGYFIILITINIVSFCIAKVVIWILEKMLSYISNVIDKFFKFESKFKEKNFSLIFISIFHAIWNVYLLFMFNIMKLDYIEIIQILCTMFLFLLSIDAIVRLLVLIAMRNEIAYKKGFNLIFKMLIYVIVYVLIINISLNYSISEYNPNSFTNSNDNSYEYIGLKKNVLYDSMINNHSNNNISERIYDNVSVIIEIDSDGKLILEKNTVGKIIETKKSLGLFNSFYYTCISMFTIGYGDITPVSWYAKLELIIMSITSVMLLVVFINLFINLSGNDKIANVKNEKNNM